MSELDLTPWMGDIGNNVKIASTGSYNESEIKDAHEEEHVIVVRPYRLKRTELDPSGDVRLGFVSVDGSSGMNFVCDRDSLNLLNDILKGE